MALSNIMIGLKSNSATVIGLAGGWGSFALSLYEKVGFMFETNVGEVNLVSVVTGLVSASLTFAIARYKWMESNHKREEAKIVAQQARKLQVENDITAFGLEERKRLSRREDLELKKKELELKILQMQIDGE